MQEEFLASREIQFDAGHRVPDHEGKCFNPHGHRYKVMLHVAGPVQGEGSETGMVLDFVRIKDFLQQVHDELDHGFMFYELDEDMIEMFTATETTRQFKHIGLPFSPTAENLAKYIFDWAIGYWESLELPGRPAYVNVWETPTSAATYPAYPR